MDKVGVERATLLGNSLGCPIIGEFIDHFPDRAERAILVSPAGGLYNQPPVRASRSSSWTPCASPGMGKFVITDYLSYGPVATFNLIRSMLAYPTTERIAELTLPTLVVLGSRDPFVSERWIKRRAVGLPHVTAVTIHGAAHAINYSHPEQLANVIRSWMADQPIVDDPTLPGGARVFLTPRIFVGQRAVAAWHRAVDEAEHGPVVALAGGRGWSTARSAPHGLAGSGAWWKRNLPALSGAFRSRPSTCRDSAPAIRMRGSSSTRCPPSWPALLGELGIERAHVMGHSMGGLVAGGLAADHPERVDRLVLVDAGFLSSTHMVAPSQRSSADVAVDLPTILPTLLRDVAREPADPDGKGHDRAPAQGLAPRLPAITAPTLVVWGQHDRICPAASASRSRPPCPWARGW